MSNPYLEIFLDGLAKRLLFWSPFLQYLLYKYRYAFTPAQLARLTSLVTEAMAVPGDVAEVGCYRGYTTGYLNQHLDLIAPERRYLAVDTFGGFTDADVRHEQAVRGKNSRPERLALANFTVNSRRWFEAMLRLNHITRVRVAAGPVQALVLPADGCFSFVLLDVDLYLPTKAALEIFWPRLSPGGIMVVDDCHERHEYDGARQALDEFCAGRGLRFELVETKLAVLRKTG